MVKFDKKKMSLCSQFIEDKNVTLFHHVFNPFQKELASSRVNIINWSFGSKK